MLADREPFAAAHALDFNALIVSSQSIFDLCNCWKRLLIRSKFPLLKLEHGWLAAVHTVF